MRFSAVSEPARCPTAARCVAAARRSASAGRAVAAAHRRRAPPRKTARARGGGGGLLPRALARVRCAARARGARSWSSGRDRRRPPSPTCLARRPPRRALRGGRRQLEACSIDASAPPALWPASASTSARAVGGFAASGARARRPRACAVGAERRAPTPSLSIRSSAVGSRSCRGRSCAAAGAARPSAGGGPVSIATRPRVRRVRAPWRRKRESRRLHRLLRGLRRAPARPLFAGCNGRGDGAPLDEGRGGALKVEASSRRVQRPPPAHAAGMRCRRRKSKRLPRRAAQSRGVGQRVEGTRPRV